MLFQEILILIPLTSLSSPPTTSSNAIGDSEEPDPDGLVPPLAELYNGEAASESRRNCTTTLDSSTQTKITWCDDAVDTVDSSAVLGNFTVDDLQEELGERHNVSKRLTKLEDEAVVFEDAFYSEEVLLKEEGDRQV